LTGIKINRIDLTNENTLAKLKRRFNRTHSENIQGLFDENIPEGNEIW